MSRATVLHRDRPTEDPAGAPSWLRWRCITPDRWLLLRDGGDRPVVGGVYRLPLWRSRRREWVWWPFGGTHRYVCPSDAAHALVEEVRRG